MNGKIVLFGLVLVVSSKSTKHFVDLEVLYLLQPK